MFSNRSKQPEQTVIFSLVVLSVTVASTISSSTMSFLPQQCTRVSLLGICVLGCLFAYGGRCVWCLCVRLLVRLRRSLRLVFVCWVACGRWVFLSGKGGTPVALRATNPMFNTILILFLFSKLNSTFFFFFLIFFKVPSYINIFTL